MEQYIPKDALVAEIESRIKSLEECFNGKFPMSQSVKETEQDKGKLVAYKSILSFIDTLEVKEVDVDKEINEHAGYMPQSEFSHDSEVLENIEWAKNEFRYFFELGMSVSKK